MRRRRVPGEGSVFKRASDGKWVAQVSIGPRTSRRYKTLTIGDRKPTRLEEQAALDKLKARVEKPAPSLPETTGAYLVRWVNEARNLRDTTRRGYRAAIVTHVLPSIGRIPLVELAPRDIERMLGQFDATLSPKTAHNAHAVVRRALGQAVRMGLVTRNVASREYVDAPRVPSDDPQAFSADDIAKILAVADSRMRPILVVAVETGLRQGELLGLAWEDVGRDTVTVRKELVYRDGRYHREEPKTPRSRRTVPLTADARAAFDDQAARLRADGYVPIATGPVFTNHRGSALSGSWVTHRLYELEAEAGVRRLPFKNLRSTFASRLHEQGVSETVIAALMGHTRTATTRKHYIAVGPDQLRAAVEGVSAQSRESVTAGTGRPG
jgi:integrase